MDDEIDDEMRLMRLMMVTTMMMVVTMMMMAMTTMMIKLIMLMMMQVKHKDNYIDSNRNIAVESGSMVPSKNICTFFH